MIENLEPKTIIEILNPIGNDRIKRRGTTPKKTEFKALY